MSTHACGSFLFVTACASLCAQEATPPVPPSEARGAATTLAVLEVRDLLPAQAGNRDPGLPGSLQADELEAAQESLLRMLRSFLPEGPGPHPGSLRISRGALIAQLDEQRTQWLQQTISRQRVDATTVVRIEARAIAGLPPDHELLADRSSPQAITDAAGVAKVIASLARVPGIRVMPPLQLAVVPCNPGQADALQYVSYVRDWQVERGVQPGNRTILDPVIDVMRGGTILRAQVLLLPDDLVGVELEFSLLDLQLPIPAAKVKVEGQDLEIGLPVSTQTRIQATVSVPVGRTIVLGTPRGQQHAAVLLLSVTSIEAPARTGDKR